MNTLSRRAVLAATILGIVIGALIIKRSFDNQIRARRLINRPVVTALASNRVTLTFTTERALRSKIEVEAPYIAPTRTLPVSNDQTELHQITLMDLRPSTKYEYRIKVTDIENIETVSEWFSFRTP